MPVWRLRAAVPLEAPATCVFCRIARHELPASVVDEDEHTLAFLDIVPLTPGHTLVVPKAHAARLVDLPLEAGGRIFEMGRRVAAGLARSGLRCEGVNFHLADGEVAGQEIFHVHLHVFPRFEGDGFHLRPGPHYGERPPREELDRVAERIRRSIPPSGGR